MDRAHHAGLSAIILAAGVSGLAIGHDAAQQAGPNEPPSPEVEWLGVEVVTDRPTLASEIRSRVPLPAHTVLDFPDDPRYREWCDLVRASYAEARTSCATVLMEGARGYYVVQVEFAPRPPAKPSCDAAAPKLPIALRAMSDRFTELLRTSLMKAHSDGAPHREFVNDEGFLDYADPGLHEFAGSAHDAVRAQMHAVMASTRVCDAMDRAAAVQMMNWSGDGGANIRTGAERLLDEDEGVRNSAMRLVGVFAANANDASSTGPLVETLCTQLGRTSFSDRNKAVNALLALADQHPSSRKAIRADCAPLIRQRASNAESISPQIHGAAASLVELLDRGD